MGNKEANQLKMLGVAIRGARLSMGYSQEVLAEMVDCHRNYVGNVERGEQNMTVKMLFRFATAMSRPASSLIRDAEGAVQSITRKRL